MSLQLKATAGVPFSTTVEALLPRPMAYHPPQRAQLTGKWALKGLQLADGSDDVERIEVIFGTEVFAEILVPGIRRGPRGAPIAQRRYGLLRRFWEVEEVPAASTLSEKERACEKLFTTSVRCLSDGRYQLRLPLKAPLTELSLGDTQWIATASLHRLERHLLRQPSLGEAYQAFLKDYAQQRHMVRLLLGVEQPRPSYFMPHHPVIKRAPELKVRVVFNALQASTNEQSLNDLMHVGPRLQRELREVLLAWRMHQILWRNSQLQPIGMYRLATVTYGMDCAPYLAIRTLHQLALDEEEHYPQAAELLRQQTYVDDILAGVDTLEEERQRQHELRSLLMAGGFHLRKWAASQSGLLSNVPESDREPLVPLPDPGTVGTSVFGIG
ncbi:uncharacterized protein LOC112588701 [Harpegnathos saltator]|uniref:uncharacterized protein LOC112588701 n=1 Tax=Harpegnathos saltator TaxID=610380 RepID=UPI000DBEDAA1|nr:uncharacterized protein LOC112588701 [Harpegnathos saltator]